MAGGFKSGSMKELQKSLNKIKGKEAEEFINECTRELAQRLLRKIIFRTPVGDYSDTYDLVDAGDGKFLVMSDKEGGTLRRGWTAAGSLEVTKTGNIYKITIENQTPYASYVEYGHRQTPGRYVPAIGCKLKKSWVQGKFMMTISERELRKSAPKILEKKVMDFLGGVLKNG